MSPGQQRVWLFVSGFFIAFATVTSVTMVWTR